MKTTTTWVRIIAVLVLAGTVGSCQTAYYSMWEQLGREKRELLKKNVESVQQEQQDAAEHFESALDRLRNVYGVGDAKLEKEYDRLKDEYDRARETAGDIHDRIDTIETIAGDLFTEWSNELDEISNPELRARSREKLKETKKQYMKMATALKNAEKRIDPVLVQLNDQVLFLKHNLNAAAIGGLNSEINLIEADIDSLIAELKQSIAEAARFLQELPK